MLCALCYSTEACDGYSASDCPTCGAPEDYEALWRGVTG
jgi:hypothetical protein